MSGKLSVSAQFVEHTLGLSEIRLNVELSCRKHHLELKRWQDEKALKASYDRVAVGQRMEAVLPDAFFAIRTPQARQWYFFLEYDRALENIKFIKKKMAAYVVYFKSGLCQVRYGTDQIRVLTVCEGTSAKGRSSRLASITKATEEAGGGKRFYFTNLASVISQNILTDPIWQIAGETTPAALLVSVS